MATPAAAQTVARTSIDGGAVEQPYWEVFEPDNAQGHDGLSLERYPPDVASQDDPSSARKYEADAKDGDRGHLAIWDSVVIGVAMGITLGRASGYCERKAFDVRPVYGTTALMAALDLLSNPESRHPPGVTTDRLWDGPLIAAGAGALWGVLCAYDCHRDDAVTRAPRDRMAILGAALLGVAGLALDIVHKEERSTEKAAKSIHVVPVLWPRGVGLSISSRF